ncbi:uncharacterized protein AMSG_03922 [Thecamonas trahens ATCC 50062]|uniref:Uncharacterized protein n=1 Tax=Thecamonas trahens ATCC 50062 TaxID=461836 RepID=A0A0L0D671_THETB|nr:hypothetical protein AMSG_03922 [Thecamonas trahens ATCC 50062]KNC47690.1 hypothetical protein AMSG_03922 [Thecamonas trahens ATCC 50062]|eukprot:XP_013759172.1 hypothetical protein AMSG_03922 [Thecamonas trahens ATCC 50062]
MEEVEYYGLMSFGSLSQASPVPPVSDADIEEMLVERKAAEYEANAPMLDPIRDVIFATFRDAVESGNPLSLTIVPSRERLRAIAEVRDGEVQYSDRLEYSLVGPDNDRPRTVLIRDDDAIATLEVPDSVNTLLFSLKHTHGLSVDVGEFVLYLKRNATGAFWLTDIRAGAWSVHTRYYVFSWARKAV